MAQSFKETAHLKTDHKKFSEGYDAINWGKTTKDADKPIQRRDMGIKKGDFVICYCPDEMQIDIGQVSSDVDETGEYDLDFMNGGSMSPGHQCAVVVPEWVAKFLAGAVDKLPVDPFDGMQKLPEDFINEPTLGG